MANTKIQKSDQSVISQLDQWIGENFYPLPSLREKFEKDLRVLHESTSTTITFDDFCSSIIREQMNISEFNQKELAEKFRFLANKFDLNHRKEPKTAKAWRTQITRTKKGESTGAPAVDVLFYGHLVKEAPYLLNEMPPPEPPKIITLLGISVVVMLISLIGLTALLFRMKSEVNQERVEVDRLERDSSRLSQEIDNLRFEADKLEKQKSGLLFYALREIREPIAKMFGLRSKEIVSVNVWQGKGNSQEIFEVGSSSERYSSVNTHPMSKLNHLSLDSTSVVGLHFKKEFEGGHNGFIIHDHSSDSTYLYSVPGGFIPPARYGMWGTGKHLTGTHSKLYTICYKSNISSDEHALCINIEKSLYPNRLTIGEIEKKMTHEFPEIIQSSEIDSMLNNFDFTKHRIFYFEKAKE